MFEHAALEIRIISPAYEKISCLSRINSSLKSGMRREKKEIMVKGRVIRIESPKL